MPRFIPYMHIMIKIMTFGNFVYKAKESWAMILAIPVIRMLAKAQLKYL